jgi:hypothetical protein
MTSPTRIDTRVHPYAQVLQRGMGSSMSTTADQIDWQSSNSALSTPLLDTVRRDPSYFVEKFLKRPDPATSSPYAGMPSRR